MNTFRISAILRNNIFMYLNTQPCGEVFDIYEKLKNLSSDEQIDESGRSPQSFIIDEALKSELLEYLKTKPYAQVIGGYTDLLNLQGIE